MKQIPVILILILISLNMHAQKNFHSDDLVPVASFDHSMAIGLSVNSENRVFVAFPNYDGGGKWAVTEETNGTIKAYPNEDWNHPNGNYATSFLRVQDMYVDAEDNLWVLDSKPAPGSSILGEGKNKARGQFKLVKINTGNNKVEKVYFFEDLDKSKAGLNDVRVDVQKNLAYLSDPGRAAIVVVDLNSGNSRTVLRESPYTLADPDVVLAYNGKEMRDRGGHPFRSHVNGIALTHDHKYFYFKPINQEHLFRIETRYLADPSIAAKALEDKVEDMGTVGITHGLIADRSGNIYLSTSTDFSISYLSPDGKVHRLVKDSRILWPDSFGIGNDGYLYFTCAQLQRLPQWNAGLDKTEYPYTVYKVRLAR
ncbi:gluconolactonase [Chitinophaga caeni]|uniref:Gluconolactonase n=1 Tax=Chitinophaga caeni TaxID=2029983 RepID=A0A291QYE3_9BACT|nr:L-dopachrome tautomerase-related protein [Chitinophaga caeni]ATL48902.1 gluconolactonase [Chitinophaga caeni]